MKSLLVGLIGGILVTLLANQFEAWLRILAVRIVRHQARKMGSRSARCEEEWLAHLAETQGTLAQLYVALGMALVPFRTAMENHRNTPGGLKRVALAWFQDHASLIAVPAVALLVVAYPPDENRYAAYAFLIPLYVLSALYLTPRFRQAFVGGYERLHYGYRVAIGGFALPIVAYFMIAWTLIPPSWQPPMKAHIDPRDSTRPRVIFIPALPLDIDRNQTKDERSANPRTVPVKPLNAVRRRESLPSNGETEVATLHASPFLNVSELAPVPFSEQPVPSPREFVPGAVPPSPQNLRILPPPGPPRLRQQ